MQHFCTSYLSHAELARLVDSDPNATDRERDLAQRIAALDACPTAIDQGFSTSSSTQGCLFQEAPSGAVADQRLAA